VWARGERLWNYSGVEEASSGSTFRRVGINLQDEFAEVVTTAAACA
jgi:hypothetical protein